MQIAKIIIAKAFQLCYGEKMFQVFNQDYRKILQKLPQNLTINFVKTGVNFTLFIYWMIIVLGTFLMLN